MGLFGNSFEGSIFKNPIKKEKNEAGEPTRIKDSNQAQEYYRRSQENTISGKKYGEELEEREYEAFDGILNHIKENKIAQRVDIQWDALSMQEIRDIFNNTRNIVENNKLLSEKIKSSFAMFSGLSVGATLMLTAICVASPEVANKIDSVFQTGGAVERMASEIRIDLSDDSMFAQSDNSAAERTASLTGPEQTELREIKAEKSDQEPRVVRLEHEPRVIKLDNDTEK